MAQEIIIPFSLTTRLNLDIKEEYPEDGAVTLNECDEIIKLIKSKGVKRGDVVTVEVVAAYRDDGKYFYDGEKIIPAYYDGIDDYGMIPVEFKVITEFPIHYWKNMLVHNCFVWVPCDSKIKQEILDNIELITTKHHSSEIEVRHKRLIFRDDESEFKPTVMTRLNKNERYKVTINDAKTWFTIDGIKYHIYIWIQEECDVKETAREYINNNVRNNSVPLSTDDREDVWINDNVDTETSFYLNL